MADERTLTPRNFDHYFIDRPDMQPGFWSNHAEANNPKPLAQAIQRPMAHPAWQEGVISAYARRDRKC